MNNPCEKCIERDFCQGVNICGRKEAYIQWKEGCKRIRKHTIEVMEREKKELHNE